MACLYICRRGVNEFEPVLQNAYINKFQSLCISVTDT